jgi:hypothetical protein
MRRVLIFILTCGIFLALGAAACTIMSDLHLPRAEGGAGDAAPDVVDDGAPRCLAIRPPPPPPSNPESTGGDDPKYDILIAVRRVIPTAESSQIGYDIDGVCTCEVDPESCAVRKGTTSPHCDFDGGRDNALTELLKAIQPILQFDILDYTNERIRTAAVGFLFRVQNYNGRPDDVEVDITAYGSLGPAVVDTAQDAGYAKYYPSFEDGGVDTWSLDRSTLENEASLIPKVKGKAYVSGGVLVISSLESLELPLISDAKTRFNGGVITGRIQLAPNGQQGAPPKLDNLQLAGRWHTTDLLTTLARTEDPRSPPKGLCEDTTFALLAKGFVCPRADVASFPVSDNKNAPCEAVSVGLGFEMVPAAFGPVVDPPVIIDRCGDASFSCDPTN